MGAQAFRPLVPERKTKEIDNVPDQFGSEEERLRHDLCVAHKVTNIFKMDMLVWNHISARLPDGSILITPGGMLWDEIAPDSISKSSYDNITADVIIPLCSTTRQWGV